jgi:hypothetical protein
MARVAVRFSTLRNSSTATPASVLIHIMPGDSDERRRIIGPSLSELFCARFDMFRSSSGKR